MDKYMIITDAMKVFILDYESARKGYKQAMDAWTESNNLAIPDTFNDSNDKYHYAIMLANEVVASYRMTPAYEKDNEKLPRQTLVIGLIIGIAFTASLFFIVQHGGTI